MVYIVELNSRKPDPLTMGEEEFISEVRRLNMVAYEEFTEECLCTFNNCLVYGLLSTLGAVVVELPEFEVEPFARMHSVRAVRLSTVHQYICRP